MSTYYSLYCTACDERTSFVADGLGGWRYMGDATTHAGPFIDRHHEHLDKLTVLIEADERYYKARSWPEDISGGDESDAK